MPTAKTGAADVLDALRAPFPPETIGKLPRVSCYECRQSQRKVCDKHTFLSNCDVCHGRHTSAVVHLDYVGHAAVTDRLLTVDPEWTWEPMAYDENGLPRIANGALWIRLTIAGVTRPGVGDADGQVNPKVMIGDAIRNAAMRFGVALDLWTKEELPPPDPTSDPVFVTMMLDNINDASTRDALREVGAVISANPGLVSHADRERLNEAWLARRDLIGQPS